MAESTITPQQAALIRKMKEAGKGSTSMMSHRHPKSMRSLRWTMGRDFYGVDEKGLARTNLSNGKPFMQWWVNPSECQWKMATRTTIEKISGGIVHHEWPQTGMNGSNGSFAGSRYDQPMLSLSFQTGIIVPGGYNDILSGNENPTTPPDGLGNFFDFLELLDQPDVTKSGAPNYINIIYASPIFGQRGIWLQGFFTEEGVSWTDTAENPNQITSWGASFMVFNSQPRLNMLLSNFEMIGIPT